MKTNKLSPDLKSRPPQNRRVFSIKKLVNKNYKVQKTSSFSPKKKFQSVVKKLGKRKKKLLHVSQQADFIQEILVEEEHNRKLKLNRKLKRSHSLTHLFKIAKHHFSGKKKDNDDKEQTAENTVSPAKMPNENKRSKKSFGFNDVLGGAHNSRLMVKKWGMKHSKKSLMDTSLVQCADEPKQNKAGKFRQSSKILKNLFSARNSQPQPFKNIKEIMGVVRKHRNQKSLDVDKLIETEYKRCMDVSMKLKESKSLGNSHRKEKLKIKPLKFEGAEDVKMFEESYNDVFVLREQKTRKKIQSLYTHKSNLFEMKKRRTQKRLTKSDLVDKEHKKAILKLEVANFFASAEKGQKSKKKLSKEARKFMRSMGLFNQAWGHINLSSTTDPIDIVRTENIKKEQLWHIQKKRNLKEYEEAFWKQNYESKFAHKYVLEKEALGRMQGKLYFGPLYSKELEDSGEEEYKPIDFVEKTKTLGKAINSINRDIGDRSRFLKRRDFKREDLKKSDAMDVLISLKNNEAKRVEALLDKYPHLVHFRDNVSLF